MNSSLPTRFLVSALVACSLTLTLILTLTVIVVAGQDITPITTTLLNEREHRTLIKEHEHHDRQHEHHHHGRRHGYTDETESSDSDVNASTQGGRPPSASNNPGQQYYSQYYNPSGQPQGGGQGQQAGDQQAQGGYDYSQYYNPKSGGQAGGGAGAGAGGGGASDPIRSGAEGSSSNIRASGELARGFIPGNSAHSQDSDDTGHSDSERYDHHRLNHDYDHHHRAAATTMAADLTSAADSIKLSEHRRTHDSKGAGVDEDETVDSSPHVPTQPELNAKWQEIGQEYAKAFVPVRDPDDNNLPVTAQTTVAASPLVPDDPQADSPSQVTAAATTQLVSRQQQQQVQQEQQVKWKEIGMRYRQQYAPPESQQHNQHNPNEKSDHRLHATTSEALASLDDMSEVVNVLDSMTRDHSNLDRAQRKAEERNEQMAKRIRRHEKEMRHQQEEASARMKSINQQEKEDDIHVSATTDSLSDLTQPIELADDIVAPTAAPGLSIPKIMLLIVGCGAVFLTTWLIYDARTGKRHYEPINSSDHI